MDRSDEQLLDEAKRGSPDAFGELFERHADAIYTFCFRGTGDWALAEDLTSAVFLEGWRRRATVELDGRDSLLPWLYGVATNVLRNQRRSMRRHRAALDRFGGDLSTRDFADDVADRLADQARMKELLELLAELPQRDRDVFGLCVFAGLEYQQAATALGIPIGTVRSRLSRARARLRELERGEWERGSTTPLNDGA